MNLIYRGQYPPKNTNVLWIKGKQIFVYGASGWEETSVDIPVDDSMIEGSTNIVESKVIQGAINSVSQELNQTLEQKQDLITPDTNLSETSENAIENSAVYKQYVTEDDVEQICELVDPRYKYSKYLTLEILGNGGILYRTDGSSWKPEIEYKKNDGEWTSLLPGYRTSSPQITVEEGDIVQLRGTNATYSYDNNGFLNNARMEISADCNIKGNIMSLISKTSFKNLTAFTGTDTFFQFFYGSNIINASELLLPAVTLTKSCYYGLFNGNTKLTGVPELPATQAAIGCYTLMFSNCSSLQHPPIIRLTTTQSACCSNMFLNCTSLLETPTLLPTVMSEMCYYGMFEGCSSITTVPYLSATTLATRCYARMFMETGVTQAINRLPATTLAPYCYENMFSYCESLTTAAINAASTLVEGCYQRMFSRCTNLGTVYCYAKTISATNCLNEWLINVKSRGEFTKSQNVTWPSGANGIPSNWTVRNVNL